MQHRKFALLVTSVVAGSVLTAGHAMAGSDPVGTVYAAQGIVDSAIDPAVSVAPDVPDTGVFTVNPANGDGGGKAYSQRYCGKYQWNNGTEAGDKSKPVQPCLGGNGPDYLVGTGTRDYSSSTADGGRTDIIHGYGGDDFLSGGESFDTLWGDAGNDILDGGVGDDYLTGGAGQDEMSGGPGADTFYAVDGERDVIHCADSADQADQDYRVSSYDYVQYDAGLDVLDASCEHATKDPQ